jgi:hypothetical protein
MEDLRAELEHRRSGEDGCIIIERQQERRHCQGHNLDGDFSVVDTTPVTLLGSRGSCLVLAPQLCMVVWPCKF